MFSRPDLDRAVADIQALLGDSGPDTGRLDETRLDETRLDETRLDETRLDEARLDETRLDEARLARIRQAVTAQDRTPSRRRTWWPSRPQRRHRRVVISCVALPVLLGATAAGWAVATSSPAIRVAGIVMCYGSPTLHPPGTFATMTHGQSPTALCASLWTSRTYMNGHPYRHLPRLVACVLPSSRNPDQVGDGRVGVYAGTTCAALHLPPLPVGYNQAARQLNTLENYLHAGAVAHCLSAAGAQAYARGALARYGFTGWVVTYPWGSGPPAGFAPQGCWAGQEDGAAHAIQVLPYPGRSVPTPIAALGPLRVMGRVLAVTKTSCQRGDPPRRAAASGRALAAALRQAGYGRWRVLVSQATTARRPCYRMNYYSLSKRIVDITSTLYVPPPTPARR